MSHLDDPVTPVTKSKIRNSRIEIRARFKATCRTCGMNVYTGDICYYFPRTLGG